MSANLPCWFSSIILYLTCHAFVNKKTAAGVNRRPDRETPPLFGATRSEDVRGWGLLSRTCGGNGRGPKPRPARRPPIGDSPERLSASVRALLSPYPTPRSRVSRLDLKRTAKV